MSRRTSTQGSELEVGVVRLSVAQIGSGRDVAGNLKRVCDVIEEHAGVSDLIVFPEAVLSGYMYESRDDARAGAVRADGPELRRIVELCAELGVHAIVGLLEQGESDELYNTAVLIDDEGSVLGRYRKTHLPCLGVDRFVDKGLEVPPVISTKHGRIGLAICYDLRFPETARALALAGAEIIAQPSTWPYEAEMLAEHFVPVRACENRVFLAVANRADSEAGVEFMGRSQIAAPSGERLVEAGTDGEQVLTTTVVLADARNKRIINVPGSYEVSLFDDRRPELYQQIVSPTQLAHEEQ